MEDLYTGFSNYDEINKENRAKAVEDEVSKWGDDADKFKEYRLKWNKAANDNYLPDFPLHLDIELSDACNLKCAYCAQGLGMVTDVGFINNDFAYGLIDQAVEMGICSLKFNWRGEAALNPILPDLVKYAKDKGILEVQMNTNGLPKKKDILIECAKNGMDRLIFSVDGFSKESYESVRIGGNYDTLVKNIHRLLDWKKENDQAKPFVRLQMVRSNVTAHEVDDFIAYWQDKVDDVRISDVMDRGQGGSFSVGDRKTIGRRRCPQPYQRLIVARDGRVSPCCADWDQKFVVGDATKDSLKDIWKNKRMTAMRTVQEKDQHDKIDICKNCYVKESFIWEKIDD
ncbi:MAG: SPASM domain-containing protein [Candidatus Cloacimonetes bacterium]|nr:SPASM domain-containing protein [Candidatus Cloacimonadota bacterium]